MYTPFLEKGQFLAKLQNTPKQKLLSVATKYWLCSWSERRENYYGRLRTHTLYAV